MRCGGTQGHLQSRSSPWSPSLCPELVTVPCHQLRCSSCPLSLLTVGSCSWMVANVCRGCGLTVGLPRESQALTLHVGCPTRLILL